MDSERTCWASVYTDDLRRGQTLVSLPQEQYIVRLLIHSSLVESILTVNVGQYYYGKNMEHNLNKAAAGIIILNMRGNFMTCRKDWPTATDELSVNVPGLKVTWLLLDYICEN